jgi:threonine/homoserine/homoserine lactone efflux protein
MPVESLIAFTIALAIAAALPGPGIVGVVARSLGFGFRAGLFMVFGLILGDLTFLMASLFGLTLLAQQLGELFLLVKLAGAAYLLYLGWKLWRAPAAPIGTTAVAGLREPPLRSLASGLLLTLGNPKTMVFYLAILPTVIDTHGVTPLAVVELAGIVVAVLLAVLTVYVAAAARARRFFTSSRAMRRLNRGSGLIMIGAAAGVAAS